MAALIASGESIISGMRFLDRGYENLVSKLQMLGANINRVQTKPDTKPIKPIAPSKIPEKNKVSV